VRFNLHQRARGAGWPLERNATYSGGMEAVRCRATAETSLRTAVDSFADIDQPRRERNKWREERQAQTYQKHRTSLHGAAVSDHPAVDGNHTII